MLPATRYHATFSVAGSCTRLNRSPKRRPGSATAQRCSLACISDTRDHDPNRPGLGRWYSPAHLSALQLLAARNRCRPSPCDRLSRPRTTTAAPPRPGPIGRRWAQPAAPRRKRGQTGEDRDGSRVHCDSLDEGGARLCPAASPRLPRSTSPWPPANHHESARSSPPAAHSGAERVRAAPGPYPPGSSRYGLEGLQTPVPRVLLSVTLAGPAPSGSAGTPRLCQGCSRPPRHLPGQAALSYAALLRQDSGGGLSPPLESTAPHGAPGWCP